jgi:hypothetical protein
MEKYDESRKFLTEEICQRWPSWKPTDKEIQDWCEVLGYYFWDVAAQAMFNYIKDAKRITARPLIAIFIEKARAIPKQPKRQEPEYVRQEGVLYGKKAREQAYRLILNGQNSPTKEWLINFLRINPKLMPSGVSLPATGLANSLPDNPDGCSDASEDLGEVIENTGGAVFRPNPDYDENYVPPDDEIPF